MSDEREFQEWCEREGILIPAFDVVWESGPGTFAVRDVHSGELLVSTDYANAYDLAEKWNKKTGDK